MNFFTVITGLSHSDHLSLIYFADISNRYATMSTNPSLQENVSLVEAGEGGSPPLEVNITPTTQAQQCLQGMALGEKEKYEKELATCAQLLNQVRGYFGFDRLTCSKAKDPVTHNDLDRALKCSSHVALKHAEAYGNAVI